MIEFKNQETETAFNSALKPLKDIPTTQHVKYYKMRNGKIVDQIVEFREVV
jgi:hypothetical protein